MKTIVLYTVSAFIKTIPYGIGFIKLDGAETALVQGIFSENLVPSKIKKGKRVKAVFNKEREGIPGLRSYKYNGLYKIYR